MFYIQVSNGLLKGPHRKAMGESVWEFMWCIDHITTIDENGVGWVLGGKPINLSYITHGYTDAFGEWQEGMGVHKTTVSRNLNKLAKANYILLSHTPYGIKIGLNKAKKIFKKGRGNFVENLGDNSQSRRQRFSNRETRITNVANPNIRQLRQETVNKFTSTKAAENLKKLTQLKQPLMQKVI